MRGGGIWIGLLLHGLPACSAARPPQDARSVGVLPPDWATAEPPYALDAVGAVSSALEENGGLSVAGAGVAARAREAEPDAGCSEDLGCLQRVGRRIPADYVVIVRLAKLTDTVLARLTLVDTRSGARERSVQRLVRPADAARVEATLRALADEIGAPFRPPERRAWYERWWVWTLIGAAVAGGATGAAVAVTGRGGGQPRPDVIVRPPVPP